VILFSLAEINRFIFDALLFTLTTTSKQSFGVPLLVCVYAVANLILHCDPHYLN
jgi:hypothetical protein